MKLILLFAFAPLLISTSIAQSSIPLSPVIDSPGKGYREMTGKESDITIKQEIESLSPEKKIEELEKEIFLLRRELKKLTIKFNEKIDLINSLQSGKSNTAEQDAAANP